MPKDKIVKIIQILHHNMWLLGLGDDSKIYKYDWKKKEFREWFLNE